MNNAAVALLVAVGKTYLPPIFSMMLRLLDSNRFLFMEVLSMFTAYEKAVLTLFRAVPRTGKNSVQPDNEKNAANGIYITPEAMAACPSLQNIDSHKFLWEKFGYDMWAMNQGFYKNFHEVQEASPKQWLIHQILHYMSVYLQNGDMTTAEKVDSNLVFIPQTELNLPDGEPIKLTVIDVIEDKEIKNRVRKAIMSGMALSQETLDCVVVIMRELDMLSLDLATIPNKELRVRLYDQLDQIPVIAQEFLRLLLFKATGNSLLIKSQSVIRHIRLLRGYKKLDWTADLFQQFVNQNGIEPLAAEFLRYKKLWLAFKGDATVSRIINKARKYSERCKYVKNIGLLERITWDDSVKTDEVIAELSKVSFYKRVVLANCLLYRQNNPESALYLIRNGTAFARELKAPPQFTAKHEEILEAVIANIVEDVKMKLGGKVFYIPDTVEYAMPTSEKHFVGGVPFYSALNLDKNVVIGIHWENLPSERVDLDLHYVSGKYYVGWNTQQSRLDEVIFSGDMTDAPKDKGGATEAFFVRDTVQEDWAAVYLNCYTYNHQPVPYKFVVGNVGPEYINHDYLINCHKMVLNINNSIDRGEDFLGFLAADEIGTKTFYFMNASFGVSIVACDDEKGKNAIKAMTTQVTTVLKLRDVLNMAGATVVNELSDAVDVDLSLDKVSKDTFINLL